LRIRNKAFIFSFELQLQQTHMADNGRFAIREGLLHRQAKPSGNQLVKDEHGNLQPELNDRFNQLYKSNVFRCVHHRHS